MSGMTDRTATLEPRAGGRYSLDPRAQLAYLWEEWRLMFRPGMIVGDALSGTAVALVALPLSLAIANASGVKPEVGLVTAIVGGIVVALFGGCRLQVSGPAAAMTFLVYEVITKHGMGGLNAATLIAGLLQVVAGIFRLGRFIQFIPRPVVAGFMSGIGLTILCTQLSVILGYDVSHDEESGAFGLLWETLRQLGHTDWRSVAVGLTALAVMLGLPRLSRRLPTPLIAVAVASLLPIACGWTQVRLLGELPRSFPMPTLPGVSWEEWNELVMAALTIFLLASLESLLSASVVESMAKQAHVDNDQELVGQGLGNVASALFGGIPVTGVIARSATNIQSGARSRLSAILHALILLASMLFLGPIVTRIPLAALAGVLTAVALRMIEVRMLRVLWRGSRPEAVVFLVTSGAILATDLIDGVQIGLIATVLYFVYEMSNMKLRPIPLAHESTADEQEAEVIHCPRVLLVHVEGPLFFASGFHMRNTMNRLNSYRCVILDLEGVSFLDVTGTQILDEEATLLHQQGIEVFLARPTEAVRQRLSTLAGDEFPAIQVCPIFDTLTDAMRHADRAIEAHGLCARCTAAVRCLSLERALRKNGDPGTPGFAAPGEAGPEIHVELPVRVVGHSYPTNEGSLLGTEKIAR